MIKSQILDTSYEMISKIYESNQSKVWLVRHKQLGEIRICKIVKKEFSQQSMEATLLSMLKHPGIPILYDFENARENLIIIEEYIKGVSLKEYLLSHPSLTVSNIEDYARQIADILIYMHDLKPKGLLYLDLKPENIIICGDKLRLIDFGLCQYEGTIGVKQATKSYASVEQMQQAKLDKRSDIYSFGKLIEELCSASDEKSHKLNQIIEKATMKNPDDRFKDLREILEILGNVDSKKEKGGKHFYKEIAVIGSDRGVGTTHVAISLTDYLNMQGLNACYENVWQEDFLQKMRDNREYFREQKGYLYHKNFVGRMNYGEGVKQDLPKKQIRVLDCGNDANIVADAYIVVCSTSPWKSIDFVNNFSDNETVIYLANNTKKAREIVQKCGKRMIGFPLDADPFVMTKEKKKVFDYVKSRLKIEG